MTRPSLVTSQFLHSGWWHILWNMLYLWIFGDNVEDHLGHVPYLLFYLGAGAAAALLQILFNPFSGLPMLGASGAIAGVMGAYFVLYPRSRVLALIPPFVFNVIEVPAIFLLGFWFLMQLFSAGAIAVSDDVLTMAPCPWLRICRISARMHRHTPARSTWRIRMKSSSEYSSSGRYGPGTPALSSTSLTVVDER